MMKLNELGKVIKSLQKRSIHIKDFIKLREFQPERLIKKLKTLSESKKAKPAFKGLYGFPASVMYFDTG